MPVKWAEKKISNSSSRALEMERFSFGNELENKSNSSSLGSHFETAPIFTKRTDRPRTIKGIQNIPARHKDIG